MAAANPRPTKPVGEKQSMEMPFLSQ